jgi:hypothetical protein
MSDDYVCASSRKSKCDKRKKRRERLFKHGGTLRTINVSNPQ